jgi:hypothetical protein
MGFGQGYVMAWAPLGLLSVLLVALIFQVLRNWGMLNALAQALGTGDFFPKVELQKEGSLPLVNLALVNSSDEDVWAEHCVVSLADFDGVPAFGFQPTYKNSLVIREHARPKDILRIGLSRVIYDAAGRPQEEYSFIISGTVQYRVKNAWFHQSFPPRRVKMCGLQPIEVRGDRKLAQNLSAGEPRLLVLSQD